MHLRTAIERHLLATGTPPTRFGRDACKDPRFVHDLRNGREIGAGLAARITAYLEGQPQ